ncbi:MAG: hypothetical protein LC753_19800, partial [Acidobacteria bacterium]|nr:hypothetical protein [Acidobacteriota bacterium]
PLGLLRRLDRAGVRFSRLTGVSVTLPLEFDTSDVATPVLKGVLALLLVVLAGVAYSLVWSRTPAAALRLLVVAAMIAYFGRLFLKHWTVSRGTITADAVIVRPVHLYGLRLAGVDGTFPVNQFKAVRVERVFAPTEGFGGPHARV